MSILAIALMGAVPTALPAPQADTTPQRIAMLQTSYGDTLAVEMRQIGHALPNRADNTRCLWKSTVTTGATETPVEGWKPGACAAAAGAIRADVVNKAEQLAMRNGASRQAD